MLFIFALIINCDLLSMFRNYYFELIVRSVLHLYVFYHCIGSLKCVLWFFVFFFSFIYNLGSIRLFSSVLFGPEKTFFSVKRVGLCPYHLVYNYGQYLFFVHNLLLLQRSLSNFSDLHMLPHWEFDMFCQGYRMLCMF